MSSLSRAERLIVGGSLLLFLFFGAAWIHLPGPQEDELLHFAVLSPAMRPDILFSAKTHTHRLPLMMMSYVGALKGWLLWLWFLVVPAGVPGYRALGLTAGVVTIWLVFRFTRRYYSQSTALATTALIATDPSFVHTIRLDYGPVALMQLFKMAGLWLGSRWLSTGSRGTLAAAAFVFGLGMWDKANFIWFLAGLGLTLLLLYPREIVKQIRGCPSAPVIALVAFLAGASPFLLYNAKRGNDTWRTHGHLEVRWFKLLQAEGSFEGTFMAALTGEDQLDSSPPAHDLMWRRVADWMYQLGRLRKTIVLPLLGLALLLLPLNLWLGNRRALLFPLLLALLTYAAMFVSFEGGSSVHHVIMVQPFAMLFLAVSFWAPVARWPRAALPLAFALTVGAIAVNLSVNARMLAIYTRTGGTGGFSDAIYRLVPYLARNPQQKIFAMDWGFANPVGLVGMPWHLTVDNLFFSVNSPDDPDHAREVQFLKQVMLDPNNVFLLHSPQRTIFTQPSQEFFALAGAGAPMREVAHFNERTGEEIYRVYQSGASPEQIARAACEVRVGFTPATVSPGEVYTVEVPEFANSWIDVVYQLGDASSGTSTRFCHLDAHGRARLTVPLTHPATKVGITQIRPSGGA